MRKMADDLDISTHSLTKRLTLAAYNMHLTRIISTHSLTRRLTTKCEKWRTIWIFQLTASQGG